MQHHAATQPAACSAAARRLRRGQHAADPARDWRVEQRCVVAVVVRCWPSQLAISARGQEQPLQRRSGVHAGCAAPSPQCAAQYGREGRGPHHCQVGGGFCAPFFLLMFVLCWKDGLEHSSRGCVALVNSEKTNKVVDRSSRQEWQRQRPNVLLAALLVHVLDTHTHESQQPKVCTHSQPGASTVCDRCSSRHEPAVCADLTCLRELAQCNDATATHR